MQSKTLHFLSFIIGFTFLTLSVYQATVLGYSHFYTSFAFGSWLVLDFIDYKLNQYSILGYFFQHKHRMAFALLFALSSFLCFIVDYLWGVKVTGIWTWVDYEPIHFFRMYLVMNISFILGMYELFRVIKTLLTRFLKLDNKSLFGVNIYTSNKKRLYTIFLILGFFGLISPSYALVFETDFLVEYAMILPFVSLILLADSITYLSGGEPILDSLLHLKKTDTLSLFLTSLSASLITEVLNLYGNEWSYTKMPFYSITLWGIPMAVFIGWMPLVFGAVALVNMVKHVDYLISKR